MIRFRRPALRGARRPAADAVRGGRARCLRGGRVAEDAWTRASREDAEEAFGDLQLIVDAIGEQLLDLRETYAATLDDAAAAEYRATFNRAAAARFRDYTELLG